MNVIEIRETWFERRIQAETRVIQSEMHTDIKILQIYQLAHVAIQP
jgi:hypothetical protein